jgi:diacylglycerol kinase family enzyme
MMLPQHLIPDGPFGVILNANAGRVTPRLAKSVQRLVGQDHVFLTETQAHAEEVVGLCIEREYPTIFAGGGDGTIMDTVNTLDKHRHDAPRLPKVGVLRLGTGNALARLMGSGRNPVRDLATFKAGDVHKTVPLRMVRCENTLFPFGGVGYDAAVLNDYYDMKNRWADSPLAGLFSGFTGYLLAGLGVTVPKYIRRSPPHVTVVNLGAPAYRISTDGKETGDPIPTGDVLYQGPASFLGGSTSPVVGYGLKFFPHASNRGDRFHLRLLNIGPVESAWLMPAAARDGFSHPRMHDFYVDRVRVIVDEAMPFQLGGDPKGYRDELLFELSEHPIQFVGPT